MCAESQVENIKQVPGPAMFIGEFDKRHNHCIGEFLERQDLIVVEKAQNAEGNSYLVGRGCDSEEKGETNYELAE